MIRRKSSFPATLTSSAASSRGEFTRLSTLDAQAVSQGIEQATAAWTEADTKNDSRLRE
jgi:hypothetical protein